MCGFCIDNNSYDFESIISTLRCPACNSMLDDHEIASYDINEGYCRECNLVHYETLRELEEQWEHKQNND